LEEAWPQGVGTIGEAVIANPSRNVIPGEIAFTVDCRSADAGIMDWLDKELRSAAPNCGAAQVEVALDLVWRKRDPFRSQADRCGGDSTKALGYSHRRITSGAGHDACNLNTNMPRRCVRPCVWRQDS